RSLNACVSESISRDKRPCSAVARASNPSKSPGAPPRRCATRATSISKLALAAAVKADTAPPAGAGSSADATRSRSLRTSSWSSESSEEANNIPILFEVDRLVGGVCRQARHGHDLARDRRQESRPGVGADLAYGDVEPRRPALQ